MADVDEILMRLNPYGKFQKVSLFLIGILTAFSGMTTYALVFYSAIPDFKCQDPTNSSNDTCAIYEAKKRLVIVLIWHHPLREDDRHRVDARVQ